MRPDECIKFKILGIWWGDIEALRRVESGATRLVSVEVDADRDNPCQWIPLCTGDEGVCVGNY